MNDQAFYTEVERKGLVLEFSSRQDQPKNTFFLDLNSGQLIVEADPKKVMKVLRIARKHASDDYGAHNAILQLVAYTAELEKSGQVYWHRPYHIRDHTGMISMEDWLKKNGQHPGVIRLDRHPINRLLNHFLAN